VKKGWYYAGKFLNAAFDKASVENERNALWIHGRPGRGRHLRAGSRADRPPHSVLRPAA